VTRHLTIVCAIVFVLAVASLARATDSVVEGASKAAPVRLTAAPAHASGHRRPSDNVEWATDATASQARALHYSTTSISGDWHATPALAPRLRDKCDDAERRSTCRATSCPERCVPLTTAGTGDGIAALIPERSLGSARMRCVGLCELDRMLHTTVANARTTLWTARTRAGRGSPVWARHAVRTAGCGRDADSRTTTIMGAYA
jgi:hypothetical protein